MAHPHWPLFDLTLTTDRLELRIPTDADLPALADLAAAGVHDPATMPFLIPWTDRSSPALERGVYQWNWRSRGSLSPADWTLGFIVVRREDQTTMGVQDLLAHDFPTRRTVSSGSWLGTAHQGRGYGREMRAAVLHLAFEGLGAVRAETGAWEDNEASLAVTRALGYSPTGETTELRRGVPSRQLTFAIDHHAWSTGPRPPVAVAGLDGARRLLGLDPSDPGAPGVS
jgi:RimJ/RimL family protein N-acetyltransferase